MPKKYCYNIFFNEVFFGEENMKTKQWSNLISPKLPFLDRYQKHRHVHFFGAWSFLLVQIRFTPSEGPKSFVNCFFKEIGPWKVNHQVGPWKKAIFHGPLCKLTPMSTWWSNWKKDLRLPQTTFSHMGVTTSLLDSFELPIWILNLFPNKLFVWRFRYWFFKCKFQEFIFNIKPM